MPEFSNYVESLDPATTTTGTILIPVSHDGDPESMTPAQIVTAGGGGASPADASETEKGVSEESTSAELLAGTATGSTGAKLFITPAKFKAFRDLTQATPILSGSDLTCNCDSKQETTFYYATLSGNANIIFSNKTNSQIHNLIIAITGSNIVLTFESDVRMARYNESGSWNQSTKALTVSSVGTGDLHEFSLKRAGSIFILRYDGPVRA